MNRVIDGGVFKGTKDFLNHFKNKQRKLKEGKLNERQRNIRINSQAEQRTKEEIENNFDRFLGVGLRIHNNNNLWDDFDCSYIKKR